LSGISIKGLRFTIWWAILFIGLVSLAFGLGRADSVRAQTEPPLPEMPPLPQGLDPPPTVYPPTQVSEGANVYYLVCMACHGDKGQGLTAEWRGALDEPDQNCWQSKCHASNYPPGGFVFPEIVPAVASPGMLARFETALDLYSYIKNEMPFQAPGSLSDQEYWQLTAFLVSLNRIDTGDLPLNEEKAARIFLREKAVGSASAEENANPYWWAAVALPGFLVTALVVLVILRRSSAG
jgi:mono/diheme cytochrome c family protein